MRILIVEDHLDTADLMARLLRRKGHEVAIAQSVADALTKTADGVTYDLALSDVMLPDGSGLELMPTLRARGVHHGIAISGTGDDAASAEAAGFTAHLLKPVQFDRLMSMIESIAQG